MKKWMLVAGVLAVAVLGAVLFAIPAFSQSPVTPPGANQAIGCPRAGGAIGGYGMMSGGYMGLANPVTLGRVADTLGLTTDQLTARLQQGETIAQVAQAQNVTNEAVVAAILAPQTEMMQVAVKYGYMTEAQVQSMLDQMELVLGQAIARPQNGAGYVPATPNTSGANGTYRGGQGYGGMMGGWTPSSPNSGSTGYGFGGGMMGGYSGGGNFGPATPNTGGSNGTYRGAQEFGGMMGGGFGGGMMGW